MKTKRDHLKRGERTNNKENARTCTKKSHRRNKNGAPGAVMRPKVAPEVPQSTSKTQMEPPSASLGVPCAPPGCFRVPQGCHREHPKQDQERPKIWTFHWFLMGFTNRCFSEATATRQKGTGLTRRCEDVLPRGRDVRVSRAHLF
jgi:hypothetical protein